MSLQEGSPVIDVTWSHGGQLANQTDSQVDEDEDYSPMVVMTVTEYKRASLNDQLGVVVVWGASNEEVANAGDGSMGPPRLPKRFLVAATMDPSKRRSCSWTSIVQFLSYSTLRRSERRGRNGSRVKINLMHQYRSSRETLGLRRRFNYAALQWVTCSPAG